MERSEFELFLEENRSLRDAAEKCADGFLGKDASDKEKENVVIIFMMGAVWQAYEYVKKLKKYGDGKK